ncbi:MAG: hypothetical protein VKM92_00845 [Cyanobacteriota bacterium]|nr:hypothetical protein [Cyanobacteriota bacterium]
MNTIEGLAASDISYSYIGSLSAEEVTNLLNSDLWAFDLPNPQHLKLPQLSRGVTLYRIIYKLDIDQLQGNAPQVLSGLLAVPELLSEESQAERVLPLAIYNHGTLFNRLRTPSQVVVNNNGKWETKSYETLINLGLLANQGYAVFAADYVGCGINFDSLHEAYGVKQPTTEAIVGLLEAGRQLLPLLGIRPVQLFINGWSQGGMNTQWALQQLEALQIPTAAAAASSPFNELQDTARWWLSQGRDNQPTPWLPLCVCLLLSSYESWYGIKGLFNTLIKDTIIPDGIDDKGHIIKNDAKVTYREILSRFAQYGDKAVNFDQSLTNTSWTVHIIRDGQQLETTIPGFTPAEMLVDGALQTQAGVELLKILSATSPRYWTYTTPLKAWYGTADEALPADLVAPGMSTAGGPLVSLVPAEAASHRQTFLNSLLASTLQPVTRGSSENFIDWFASFRKPTATVPSLVLANNALLVVSEDYGLLPIRLIAQQQEGTRAMHVLITRVRQDGRTEFIGSMGGTTAADNQLQSLGSERVYLQVGDQLAFQLLSDNDNTFETFTTVILPRKQDTGFDVTIKPSGNHDTASLTLAIIPEASSFTFTDLDAISAPRRSENDGLLQLNQGQKLKLDITTDCAFKNRLGFVRLNQDSITGLINNTAGLQNIRVDSEQFRNEIEALLEPGFQMTISGRQISSNLEWTVERDGIYAPVLITPQGNVFCGANGAIGSQQLRALGQGNYGFEDSIGPTADNDWNDVVVAIKAVI